jgi:hypothetical protein
MAVRPARASTQARAAGVALQQVPKTSGRSLSQPEARGASTPRKRRRMCWPSPFIEEFPLADMGPENQRHLIGPAPRGNDDKRRHECG